MNSLNTVLSFALLSALACQPLTKSVESDVASAGGGAKPLPIEGTFKATEVWASTEESPGVRKAVHAASDELENGLWRVKLSINPEGTGLIQGLVKCQVLGPATRTPPRLNSFQVMNALFGLLSLPNLIRQSSDDVKCATSADGAIQSLLVVSPSRNFLGQDQTSMPKNLGLVGESRSLYAVDNECAKLRGVRFVNIRDSSACIGFTDSKANRIRFLILPPGEIYAIRVNMVRD